MSTKSTLIEEIKQKASSVRQKESSRRETVLEGSSVEISGDIEVSRVLLNHCVSKQQMSGFCGISGPVYAEMEAKAIKEGKMEPAIKHSGRWQYTPSHIHAMLDYLNRPAWKDKSETAVINIQNQKGGTGKSTTLITLATNLALDHHNRLRICVIDLDPQGSLRTFIDNHAMNASDDEFDILTAVDLMLGDQEDDSHYAELRAKGHSHDDIVNKSLLASHLHNLHIIPAFPSDERFSSVAWQSGLAQGNKDCLKLLKEKVIDVVRDQFDVILIDTGPQVNPLTWNALYATGGLIIPVTPHKLDWKSTIQFYDSLPLQIESLPDGSEEIRFVKFLITNKDTENDRDSEVVDMIKDDMGQMVMNSHILKTSAFESAARHYRTVCDIRKSDKLCPPLQLDKAMASVASVTSEFKGLLKDNF
ncbi:ParA family protein [Vibrio owensii]|uniref:ParA family protein n=1 Tax=Vibrio owensii TaxID=696485 RepID=UPI0018F222C8|nr:ParA family protein [Vibrio owensii]